MTSTSAPKPGDLPTDLGWISWTCLILIAGALFNIAFVAALNFAGPQPFRPVVDDSLMLVRYADNLLRYGAMIWNPGGPPTYGLTSPYYFLCVVMPVRELITASPIGVAVCSSLISGLLFFGAMTALVLFRIPGPLTYKLIALTAVCVSLAWSASHVVGHLLSGMDALFGLFYFTVYLFCLSWHSSTGTASSAILAGIVGGLAFGSRPDLLIYSLLVPLIWIGLVRNQRERRRAAALMLGCTILTLIAQMAFAASYFQSPLPLSFYAKSLKLYPGLAGYGVTSLYSFLFFISSYWLLFLLIVLNAAVNWASWRRETAALDKALIAGLAAHMAYILFGIVPIMGQNQRFNYADLPVLIYLSTVATVRLLSRISTARFASLNSIPPTYRYAAFAAAFFFLLPTVTNVQPLAYLLHGNFATFNLTREYKAFNTEYWFALDKFSALPDNLDMAATEIGHVAAMNLNKKVFDFSGLNETRFAHHQFSANVFFANYSPDLIFMPHPGYRGMMDQLENSPVFRTRYVWLPPEATGNVGTGIALRKDSRYYFAMRDIVLAACAEPLPVPCSPAVSQLAGAR